MLFTIWYQRNPTFGLEFLGWKPAMKVTLKDTHKLLCTVDAIGRDDAFVKMQAEVWSPNGEMTPLIKRMGLKHTSMSVGDVLCNGKQCWEVANEGFREME